MSRRNHTALELFRDELNLTAAAAHEPQWRIEDDGPRFTWVLDGERPVGMLDRDEDAFELLCAGPDSPCPEKKLPRHYHNPEYRGVRLIYAWRLRGKGAGECLSTGITRETDAASGAPVIRNTQHWSDGTRSESTIRMRFDPAWNAYVADIDATLRLRRNTTALEYCNIIPAAIGDSRPGRERFPLTFWQHPDGLRKMLKNPLWFCSAGAQDLYGEKHIAQGGFLGFGPDDELNPVIEIVASDPETGATTCDGLQDEHIMIAPAEGRHAAATGWFELRAAYRVYSIPRTLCEHIVDKADFMRPGAMLAWKFQYPPTPELPADLSRVELPGSPFYGASDWSKPVPWDAPYNGRLWTASPDPAAPIHYDRGMGRTRPGSIRMRVEGAERGFWPGSGHTLHTDGGVTYRASVWIRTEGSATGWLDVCDTRFRTGDGNHLRSEPVGPDSDWTRVQVELTARGRDAPFAETMLFASGTGKVWFTELCFEPAG